jgi:hypothetical protein
LLAVVVGIALGVATTAASAPAYAEDRVAALTKQLESRSDKTRLAAVLALAKLGEPGALKPLVTALRDRNFRVRAVAATALGRLEYTAALPTLRVLATDDRDEEVRKAAGNAAIKITQASHRQGPRPEAEGDAQARRVAATTGHGLDRAATSEHADLYLLVSSAADESPGLADKPTRQRHADVIKRVLLAELTTEPSVTSLARDAQRWGLPARHIDLSVTRLDVRKLAGALSINAELRVTISDDNGKLLSFLTGGAKVEVPNQKLDPKYLPALRVEALENAMRGMCGKLLAHLHDQAPL